MSKNEKAHDTTIVGRLPEHTADSFPIDPRSLQPPIARTFDASLDRMKQWFQMKYYDDLSDIRWEVRDYYKHYVHTFVLSFFTEDKVAGKRILDFGCGPGFYSVLLAQRGADVVGIDRSSYLIEKGEEHKARLGLTNVKFMQAEFGAYASQCESASFNYVIAIDTIVSFDYGRNIHNHDEVVSAFRDVRRLLKEDGRFVIIENHPFFGQVTREVASPFGEYFCIRHAGYKIGYKPKGYPHHWFTLDEMTRATSESGLAVLRIYEPDPSIVMKSENSKGYSFRRRYPGMIVYEMCEVPVLPSTSRK